MLLHLHCSGTPPGGVACIESHTLCCWHFIKARQYIRCGLDPTPGNKMCQCHLLPRHHIAGCQGHHLLVTPAKPTAPSGRTESCGSRFTFQPSRANRIFTAPGSKKTKPLKYRLKKWDENRLYSYSTRSLVIINGYVRGTDA